MGNIDQGIELSFINKYYSWGEYLHSLAEETGTSTKSLGTGVSLELKPSVINYENFLAEADIFPENLITQKLLKKVKFGESSEGLTVRLYDKSEFLGHEFDKGLEIIYYQFLFVPILNSAGDLASILKLRTHFVIHESDTGIVRNLETRISSLNNELDEDRRYFDINFNDKFDIDGNDLGYELNVLEGLLGESSEGDHLKKYILSVNQDTLKNYEVFCSNLQHFSLSNDADKYLEEKDCPILIFNNGHLNIDFVFNRANIFSRLNSASWFTSPLGVQMNLRQ